VRVGLRNNIRNPIVACVYSVAGCYLVIHVRIYICRDNHLSNCSIIYIIIAQYTQMYLKNGTSLAETANPAVA
jgi:hypothetical protein